MWCPQTINPRNPIDSIAQTMPWYPKISLPEYLAITWLIIPKAGSIKM